VDLRTVDLVARLRLATGARVACAPHELWELIDLCGLLDALRLDAPAEPPSPGRKGSGQAEPREERLRVEEEGQLGDPAG
jgi:hypothetical protein